MASPTDDPWFRAQGTRDGMPVLIRGRQNLNALVRPESHSKLLRIAWNYLVESETGLPVSPLDDNMAAFENAIFNDLERDRLCMLFSVYTHNGIKEWCAYTSDAQASSDRINIALEPHEPFPIEMTVEDDPGWTEYKDLLRGTGMDLVLQSGKKGYGVE